MGKRILLLLLVACYVLNLSCAKGDDSIQADDSCLIEKIISEEFVYEYKYNVRGDLFIINQEFRLTEPNPTFLRVYVKTVTPDSIAIGRLTNNFVQDEPRITAKYDEGQIVELKRFFTSGETNILNFTYTSEKVRITVDYDNGQGGMQKVSYGDYFFDGDNISKVEKYEYGANPNEASLVEVKSYTYDTANNPWQGLVFPVFLCPELPEARFFSKNNILTETSNGEEALFQFEYDGDLTLGARVPLFTSCASSNERIQETYTYLNCSN